MIQALYILNLIAYPLIYLLCPVYFTRYFKLGWINLITILAAVSLPVKILTTLAGPMVFLEHGWFNPYFQYALAVQNVHDVLGSFVLLWLVRQLVTVPAYSQFLDRVTHMGVRVRPERMRVAAWLFLGLFVVAFVLLAQPTFGLINWILAPRTGYQLYRTGVGQWYALAITFLSVSMVLATTYARSSYAVVALSPIYLFGTYLLGSKAFIVSFAAYLVIILGIRQFKYFRSVAVIVLLAGLILVGYNFASALGGVGLEEIAAYSDYFVNAAKYYEMHLTGRLPLYYGGIAFTNFWWLVPRALYPEKPYVYGIIKVIDVFYPGAAEATNTPEFTTVEYYADFGWVGVVLYGLLNVGNIGLGFLYAIILPRLKTFNYRNRIPHNDVLFYAFLWLIGPAFLAFFIFPLNLVLLFIIIRIINLTNRIRFTGSLALRPGERA